MSKFFSFVSNGRGDFRYLNHVQRKQFLDGKIEIESPDSHTSILEYYNIIGKQQDKWNKYEYNFLTQKFRVDCINARDDQEKAEAWARKIKSKSIVPELIIKKIINPLFDYQKEDVTSHEKILLNKWAYILDSVRFSVKDSVWAYIGEAVWDFVRVFVKGFVGDSIGDFVRASIMASVWASVWDFVRPSVWDAVWNVNRPSLWAFVVDSVVDFVGAYASSFFKISEWDLENKTQKENPFLPAVELWEAGLVPSFDGRTWRLHGHKGKILYEKEF